MMTERVCQKCDKVFQVKLWKVKRGWGKFCSISCNASYHASQKVGEKNPNWKGGITSNNYQYKKIQVQRYPSHIRARDAVYKAIRASKITRQPCESCGNRNVQAHHDDYMKPLDVRWMCRRCHGLHHQGVL